MSAICCMKKLSVVIFLFFSSNLLFVFLCVKLSGGLIKEWFIGISEKDRLRK